MGTSRTPTSGGEVQPEAGVEEGDLRRGVLGHGEDAGADTPPRPGRAARRGAAAASASPRRRAPRRRARATRAGAPHCVCSTPLMSAGRRQAVVHVARPRPRWPTAGTRRRPGRRRRGGSGSPSPTQSRRSRRGCREAARALSCLQYRPSEPLVPERAEERSRRAAKRADREWQRPGRTSPMKRLTSIVLVALLAFGAAGALAGCGLREQGRGEARPGRSTSPRTRPSRRSS